MSYFPFFADLENSDALIVGGGPVAARKAAQLLAYGPRLTVVAEKFCSRLAAMDGVCRVRGSFSMDMLPGRALVIAATDDGTLNHAVSDACKRLKIPVNVVDDQAACTFLFPALIKRGDVCVGITTGGASPSAAHYLRETVEAALPEEIGEICRFLGAVRPDVKAAIPDGAARAAAFKVLFARCLTLGRPLTGEEFCAFLAAEGAGHHG